MVTTLRIPRQRDKRKLVHNFLLKVIILPNWIGTMSLGTRECALYTMRWFPVAFFNSIWHLQSFFSVPGIRTPDPEIPSMRLKL